METISHSTPKARKEHKCDWCGETINVGEQYNRAFCKDDYVYVWKNHIHCEKIAQELNMFENGSVTEDDFVDHITEEYQTIMSKNFNDLYESKDFKYPKFKEQLDFVLEFHKIPKVNQ